MPNDKTLRPSEADEDICQGIVDTTVANVGETHQVRRSVKYDGVLGCPP